MSRWTFLVERLIGNISRRDERMMSVAICKNIEGLCRLYDYRVVMTEELSEMSRQFPKG